MISHSASGTSTCVDVIKLDQLLLGSRHGLDGYVHILHNCCFS